MSLDGISGVPATISRRAERARSKVEQERSATAVAPQPTAAESAGGGVLALPQEALPAQAPAGTDPELWRMLGAEERAYFARMTAMGPLTYGRPSRPIAAGEAMLSRGGRIDVKA